MKVTELKPATNKIQCCSKCMGEFDSADLFAAPYEAPHYDAVCEFCYDDLVMIQVRMGDY